MKPHTHTCMQVQVLVRNQRNGPMHEIMYSIYVAMYMHTVVRDWSQCAVVFATASQSCSHTFTSGQQTTRQGGKFLLRLYVSCENTAGRQDVVTPFSTMHSFPTT